MPLGFTRSTIGLFSAMLAIAPVMHAQRVVRPTLPHPNVISTNPFGPIYEMFTGEYERRVNASISVGLSGTYWSRKLDDELRQNSLNVRVRFYPYERTPNGFSIGVSGGITRIRGKDDSCSPAPCTPVTRTTTNPTFGVEGAYNWFMGPSQRFVFGTGVGIKRLFGDVAGENTVLPMFRLNVGYAF